MTEQAAAEPQVVCKPMGMIGADRVVACEQARLESRQRTITRSDAGIRSGAGCGVVSDNCEYSSRTKQPHGQPEMVVELACMAKCQTKVRAPLLATEKRMGPTC